MNCCRSCKAPVIWTTIVSTRSSMPLNVEEREPALKLVAHNSITGFGHVLSELGQLEAVRAWHEPGVSFHEPHWATCPYAEEHRR